MDVVYPFLKIVLAKIEWKFVVHQGKESSAFHGFLKFPQNEKLVVNLL